MDLFIIMLFTFCQSTVFSIPAFRLLFNGIVIYTELVGMETNWTLEAVLSSSAAMSSVLISVFFKASTLLGLLDASSYPVYTGFALSLLSYFCMCLTRFRCSA